MYRTRPVSVSCLGGGIYIQPNDFIAIVAHVHLYNEVANYGTVRGRKHKWTAFQTRRQSAVAAAGTPRDIAAWGLGKH